MLLLIKIKSTKKLTTKIKNIYIKYQNKRWCLEVPTTVDVEPAS